MSKKTRDVMIRAKWVMDGAETLGECAELLHAFADELTAMEKEGWQLDHPVQDDYGFISRSKKR